MPSCQAGPELKLALSWLAGELCCWAGAAERQLAGRLEQLLGH